MTPANATDRCARCDAASSELDALEHKLWAMLGGPVEPGEDVAERVRAELVRQADLTEDLGDAKAQAVALEAVVAEVWRVLGIEPGASAVLPDCVAALKSKLGESKSALAECVEAMAIWGRWEDGVPDAGELGEYGRVGKAYDAACRITGKITIPRPRWITASPRPPIRVESSSAAPVQTVPHLPPPVAEDEDHKVLHKPCAAADLSFCSVTSTLRTERDQALLVVQALGQRIESLRASLAEAAELADSLSNAPAVRALSDRWRASADLPPGGAAPRQSIVEGLVEALDEAATSLETASRWGTREGEASGLPDLRQWARSRAESARRALAGLKD